MKPNTTDARSSARSGSVLCRHWLGHLELASAGCFLYFFFPPCRSITICFCCPGTRRSSKPNGKAQCGLSIARQHIADRVSLQTYKQMLQNCGWLRQGCQPTVSLTAHPPFLPHPSCTLPGNYRKNRKESCSAIFFRKCTTRASRGYKTPLDNPKATAAGGELR